MPAKTKIGKDVIESLTMGMYEDSRFIYREYVQNSADQIDIALQEGLFQSKLEGYIDIEIEKSNNLISIMDNATGISKDKAETLLKNIAKSSKDRTRNKGFRGIGRLGGLGYCNTLKFETTYKGEDIKSTLIWDSVRLKEIINDRSKQQDAASVIDEVTQVKYDKCEIESHYFKVTMIGVTNELLLDKNGVIDYLSMVAPLPFDKGFIYAGTISEGIKSSRYSIDEYNLFVNTDQVFKSYTSTIYSGDGAGRKKFSEIVEIQTFQIGKKIWGWYSISDNLTKQIPSSNLARGIRLRKGNIQVGGDASLARFFAEERFNYYFFGEVHVFDSDLIPNARRDYFIENRTLQDFESQLGNLFGKELSRLIRYASSIKSTSNPIRKFADHRAEYEDKLVKGFSDKEDERRYQEEHQELKEKAQKAEEDLKKEEQKVDPQSSKGKIFNYVTSDLERELQEVELKDSKETVFITDSLSKLDRKERKLVSKVFKVIDQVLPKEIAENLKEKVKEEFQ